MSHSALVFDILFIPPEPEPADPRDPDDWPALIGEITLGDEGDGFRAPIGVWTAADYERQWHAAATRLLSGSSTGFWTIPWQFWFVAWPEGEEAVFHEQLLLPERLEEFGYVFEPPVGAAPYEMIGPRVAQTEEGQPYSEWRVPLNAVRSWLAKQAISRADT